MASRASFSDDSTMIKRPLPKSLLLKDYLLDDLSSCSSNGFRSYPRRQCCTAVRFLVEADLHKHSNLHQNQLPQPFLKSKTKSKKQSSVLQRASASMINAFKHFPFAGVGAGKPRRTNFLPRNLSRKLLKHGFWKRSDHHNKEIKRLKSFGDFIKEKETSPASPPSIFSTTVSGTGTAEINSSTSNSNSWSDSDFTGTTDSFTGGNSSEITSAQNDVVDDLPANKNTTNGKRVGVTTATAIATNANCSATAENAKKKWQNEKNEQFSPVSVMEFPSSNDNDVDDEDEVSSAFKHTKHDVKEKTQKSMNKIRRFEGVAQLEPLILEDRIVESLLESPLQTCLYFAQKDNQIEKKALALFQLLKTTISSHELLKSEIVEGLLLGFFKERITEKNVSDYEMLQVAKDWMNGQSKDMFLDWEFQNNRQTYIGESERGVKWSKYDEIEKEEVGLELDYEIFTSLVDEILLDFRL